MTKLSLLKRAMIRKHRLLLMTLIALSLLLSAWQVQKTLYNEEIVLLQEKLNHIEEEKVNLKETVALAPELEIKEADLSQKLKYNSKAIATADKVPFVLASLENTLNEGSVELDLFKAEKTVTESDFSRVRVSLRLAGFKGSLQRLLEDLDNFSYRLVFDRVSWERIDNRKAGLELELHLIVADPVVTDKP